MSSLKFCPKCGTPVMPGDAFCVNCGIKLEQRSGAPRDTDPLGGSNKSRDTEPLGSTGTSRNTEPPGGADTSRKTEPLGGTNTSRSTEPLGGSAASRSTEPTGGTNTSRNTGSTGNSGASRRPEPTPRAETIPFEDTQPTPPPQKPKGGFKRLLVTLVIVGLAYGGGKLLGKQMANDFKSSDTPRTTAAIQAPAATQIPLITPMPTRVPSATAAPVAPAQGNTGGARQGVWDYLEASDSEISDAMAYFWYGVDSSTGAQCAFFSDKDAHRGGYYWWIRTSERFSASFTVGTFVNPQPDSDVIRDRDEDTPVTLRSHSDGTLDFNFGSGEYISGTLRLSPDDSHRQEVLNMILNYKNTLSKMM